MCLLSACPVSLSLTSTNQNTPPKVCRNWAATCSNGAGWSPPSLFVTITVCQTRRCENARRKITGILQGTDDSAQTLSDSAKTTTKTQTMNTQPSLRKYPTTITATELFADLKEAKLALASSLAMSRTQGGSKVKLDNPSSSDLSPAMAMPDEQAIKTICKWTARRSKASLE